MPMTGRMEERPTRIILRADEQNGDQLEDIGEVYKQPLIVYTARLVSVRFLLTGRSKGLFSDSTVRVSVKSAALGVLAQCVRLVPDILRMPLKYTLSNINVSTNESDFSANGSPKKSTAIWKNFRNPKKYCEWPTKVDSHAFVSSDADVRRRKLSLHTTPSSVTTLEMTSGNGMPLLEMHEDHFGSNPLQATSTTDSSMTRSAEPVIPSNKIASEGLISSQFGMEMISMSEKEQMPLLPPKPPKRMKLVRKNKLRLEEEKKLEQRNPMKSNVLSEGKEYQHQSRLSSKQKVNILENSPQYIIDVLHFYNHEDPIIRSGIQQIIGNYISPALFTTSSKRGLAPLQLQYLLAILCKVSTLTFILFFSSSFKLFTKNTLTNRKEFDEIEIKR